MNWLPDYLTNWRIDYLTHWPTDWLIDWLIDWLTDYLANWVIFRHLNAKKCSKTEVFCTFWLENVVRATAACNFSRSELQKVARARQFLCFWLANALDRAGVFCTFWLANVLRATAACHFSKTELQKLVRACGVLCILTWKCAPRQRGAPFFDIGTSKISPRMWCFGHF